MRGQSEANEVCSVHFLELTVETRFDDVFGIFLQSPPVKFSSGLRSGTGTVAVDEWIETRVKANQSWPLHLGQPFEFQKSFNFKKL